MVKFIYLFLKPTKILIFLPIIAMVILLVGTFSEISNLVGFISGITTGLYASLFWFVLLQNSQNKGPFMNQSLIFSLPLHKKELVKPWFIANQLCFIFIYASACFSILILDLWIKPNTSNTGTYVSMLILALVSCILFNLATPLSFFSTSKKAIILSVLLFITGIIMIPFSQVLFIEVLTRMSFKFLYILFILVIYCLTTLITYKKTLILIVKTV